jgi:hypothetical protein
MLQPSAFSASHKVSDLDGAYAILGIEIPQTPTLPSPCTTTFSSTCDDSTPHVHGAPHHTSQGMDSAAYTSTGARCFVSLTPRPSASADPRGLSNTNNKATPASPKNPGSDSHAQSDSTTDLKTVSVYKGFQCIAGSIATSPAQPHLASSSVLQDQLHSSMGSLLALQAAAALAHRQLQHEHAQDQQTALVKHDHSHTPDYVVPSSSSGCETQLQGLRQCSSSVQPVLLQRQPPAPAAGLPSRRSAPSLPASFLLPSMLAGGGRCTRESHSLQGHAALGTAIMPRTCCLGGAGSATKPPFAPSPPSHFPATPAAPAAAAPAHSIQQASSRGLAGGRPPLPSYRRRQHPQQSAADRSSAPAVLQSSTTGEDQNTSSNSLLPAGGSSSGHQGPAGSSHLVPGSAGSTGRFLRHRRSFSAGAGAAVPASQAMLPAGVPSEDVGPSALGKCGPSPAVAWRPAAEVLRQLGGPLRRALDSLTSAPPVSLTPPSRCDESHSVHPHPDPASSSSRCQCLLSPPPQPTPTTEQACGCEPRSAHLVGANTQSFHQQQHPNSSGQEDSQPQQQLQQRGQQPCKVKLWDEQAPYERWCIIRDRRRRQAEDGSGAAGGGTEGTTVPAPAVQRRSFAGVGPAEEGGGSGDDAEQFERPSAAVWRRITAITARCAQEQQQLVLYAQQ